MLQNITDADFEEKVLKNSKPVLVDFWASWCGPCMMLGPTIEEIAEEMDGKIDVCKVNVEENQQYAAKYGVQGIPNVILFKDGKVVENWVGVQPKANFLDGIEEHLEN